MREGALDLHTINSDGLYRTIVISTFPQTCRSLHRFVQDNPRMVYRKECLARGRESYHDESVSAAELLDNIRRHERAWAEFKLHIKYKWSRSTTDASSWAIAKDYLYVLETDTTYHSISRVDLSSGLVHNDWLRIVAPDPSYYRRDRPVHLIIDQYQDLLIAILSDRAR